MSSATSVSTASPVERRSCVRRRIKRLTYADFGTDNGAILIDLSDGGLGFQSVAPLHMGQALLMKFKTSKGGSHTESCAEVVWLDKSAKRGGLRFVELSADARVQIHVWLTENLAAGEAAREIHEADKSRDSTPTEERNSPDGAHPNITTESESGNQHHSLVRLDRFPESFRPGRQPRSASPLLRESAARAIVLLSTLLRDDATRPEGQALRHVLECLYALKKGQAGTAVDHRSGGEPERRRRANLIVSVCLAVLMSFTAGWFLERRTAKPNDHGQIAEVASHPARDVDSHRGMIVGAPNPPVPDTLPQERPEISALPIAASAPDINKPDVSKKDTGSAIAGDHDAILENGQSPESLKYSAASPASAFSQPLENPPFQDLGKLPAQPAGNGSTSPLQKLDRPNAAPEAPAKPTGNPPSPLEAQGRPKISPGSVSVSFSTNASIRLAPELKSQAGSGLQMAQLISHVDPIYPEDAKRQRIEGTVKLHAIIGTDGAVQSAEAISGPPLLVPAAVIAIRQWRYKPTLLGDNPIETGEDISVQFRLASKEDN